MTLKEKVYAAARRLEELQSERSLRAARNVAGLTTEQRIEANVEWRILQDQICSAVKEYRSAFDEWRRSEEWASVK